MTDKKTVLILGAGASVPYGFPAGQKLCDIIRVDLKPADAELEQLGVDPRHYDTFHQALKHAGRTSVDAFLESKPDFMPEGKLAIALTLLPREQPDRLFDDWPASRIFAERMKKKGVEPRVGTSGGHWYELLFNMLTEGRGFEEIDLEQLAIVTFNYDRSLEHYFFTTLKNAYDQDEPDIRNKLRGLRIIHVHGSLGQLPWQSEPVGTNTVAFGDKGRDEILRARDSIKVLHETEKTSDEFEEARELIALGDRVYFFGFGFHSANLLRLGTRDMMPNGPVGGTTRGLSYDTITKTKEFRLFINSPVGGSSWWQDKDMYDYLYDHFSFDA